MGKRIQILYAKIDYKIYEKNIDLVKPCGL